MDQFMEAALEEARTGAAEGGIPIGAALVDGEDRLVATGRNRRVQDRAVVMHAEINCLFNAGKTVSDFRGMTMYSTLMPCHMCAGAVVQFGITKVIVGESENFQCDHGLVFSTMSLSWATASGMSSAMRRRSSSGCSWA